METLEEINKQYPINEVLGDYNDYWQSDELTDLNAVSFLRNSPAQSSEAERLIGRIIGFSAREGKWIGYETGWPVDEIQYLHASKAQGKPLENLGRGVLDAIETNLISFEEKDGKLYVLPQEGLVEFVKQKVEEYSKMRGLKNER